MSHDDFRQLLRTLADDPSADDAMFVALYDFWKAKTENDLDSLTEQVASLGVGAVSQTIPSISMEDVKKIALPLTTLRKNFKYVDNPEWKKYYNSIHRLDEGTCNICENNGRNIGKEYKSLKSHVMTYHIQKFKKPEKCGCQDATGNFKTWDNWQKMKIHLKSNAHKELLHKHGLITLTEGVKNYDNYVPLTAKMSDFEGEIIYVTPTKDGEKDATFPDKRFSTPVKCGCVKDEKPLIFETWYKLEKHLCSDMHKATVAGWEKIETVDDDDDDDEIIDGSDLYNEAIEDDDDEKNV